MFSLGGRFRIPIFSADGCLKTVRLAPNSVTDAALNDVLEVYFRSGTQKTAWYIGLISSASFVALADADTIASHAGWTEFTDYSEGTRGAWSPGAATGGTLQNSTYPTFTVTVAGTVKGAFLVSNSTKGGTTGLLYCHALFPEGDQTLAVGDVLRPSYEGIERRV